MAANNNNKNVNKNTKKNENKNVNKNTKKDNKKTTKKTETKNRNSSKVIKKVADGKYEATIREPWRTLIQIGMKTVEGRIRDLEFANVKKGDTIVWKSMWKNKEMPPLTTTVEKVANYKNFKELMQAEGAVNVVPGSPSIACAMKMLSRVPKKYEDTHGVVAFHLKPSKNNNKK